MTKYVTSDPEFKKIKSLTRIEIARLIRYAPSGHIYFDSSKPYYKFLMERFKLLGGWSTEISKQID